MKDQFIGMSIKQSETKNTTNECRYFLESNFVGVNRLFVLVYTNEVNNIKRFNARKYYLPKSIIKYCNGINYHQWKKLLWSSN